MPEWFCGEYKTRRVRKVPVEVHWLCPQDGCEGEMKPTGLTFPMKLPGYVHACDKCGYSATCKKHFPRIEYEDDPTNWIL